MNEAATTTTTATMTTIERAIEQYLESLWAVHYASNTMKLRRQDLARFCAWARGRGLVHVADVEREHVEAYRLEMRARGVTAGSQETYFVTLRHFFAFVVREGELAASPTADVEVAGRPKQLPRAVLTHGEVEGVLASINTSSALGLRDRAMLELLYSSGLRRAELLALDVNDVDLDELLVRVRGGKGAKDRVVPIGRRAARWIASWLGARGQLARGTCARVFISVHGEDLSERELTEIGHEHIERALWREVGACHVSRHSAATEVLRNGADVRHVQELLGHEDIRTTQRYTKVAVRDLVASHARYHPTA